VNCIASFLQRIWNWFVRNNFYQSQGGGLEPNAPTYVRRVADDDLLEFAKAERSRCGVCYILAPRQTGKTSLMNQAVYEFSTQGIFCLQIVLQEFGTIESEEKLYFNLLRRICQEISKNAELNVQGSLGNLTKDLDGFWSENLDIPPSLRFKEFIISEILVKINCQLIIFIDEIQSLIGWELQDSFTGLLKSLWEDNKPALSQVAFVLLGFAKPSDLVTNYIYAFNFGQRLELSYLEGDCTPLQKGLESVTLDPARVLTAILFWTGGQPFLTQSLCDLVAKSSKTSADTNIEAHIGSLVGEELLENWRQQDKLSHFRGIEQWFRRVPHSQKAMKLAALRIYRSILASGKRAIKFDDYDSRHWELLISGLVRNEGGCLEVANRIYQQVFDLTWVEQCETYLQEDFMENFSTIYDRDVFILIDQSGSMVRKDTDTGNQNRYDYLKEIVEGHINSILSENNESGGKSGQKICDFISVYFFSRNEVADYPIKVRDAGVVQSLFLENKPKTKTFIGPTIERCLDIWVTEGKQKNRGAFFIIYTDGLFDDELRFIECVKKASEKIESDKEVKFVILGLGTDIDIKTFLELDYNVTQSLKHNILVFNLVNAVDDIINELERQLVDNPGLAFPEWVKTKYPDIVEEAKKACENFAQG
jgi:hypothetical protein